MFAKGITQGLVISLLLLSFAFILSRIGFSEETTRDGPVILYMILVMGIGYLLKRKRQRSIYILEVLADKGLLRYAFGVAIPIVSLAIFNLFEEITSVGSMWPLFLLVIIPFAIFSQILNFWVLVVFGSWLCKETF
jgi:hypothetical protein